MHASSRWHDITASCHVCCSMRSSMIEERGLNSGEGARFRSKTQKATKTGSTATRAMARFTAKRKSANRPAS